MRPLIICRTEKTNNQNKRITSPELNQNYVIAVHSHLGHRISRFPSKIRTFLANDKSLYRTRDHLSIIDIAPGIPNLAWNVIRSKTEIKNCILISENEILEKSNIDDKLNNSALNKVKSLIDLLL